MKERKGQKKKTKSLDFFLGKWLLTCIRVFLLIQPPTKVVKDLNGKIPGGKE